MTMHALDIASHDPLPIALRAYAEPPPRRPGRSRPVQTPSEWTLILDTETTTDAGQALRFGAYQVRRGEALYEAGLFYRPEVLGSAELALLADYAARHGLTLRTQAEFIDTVFYGIGYDLRATIVGFNLPFDLSRLAIRYGTARRDMRGGFSFVLSADKRRPALRIRHLSRRMSFIKFAAPFRQRAGNTDRRRGRRAPVRTGFFVDVNTLAFALLSRSFSLGSLAEHLGTATRKADTDEHGGPLSEPYVRYAVLDLQVTWECYVALNKRYAALQLTAPVHRIYSEASLGKAYLMKMGVRPWREVQPDVPPALIGTILSTYFGGRSEVRIRREVRQVVLCDFLSMYPTVCTLMGLWRFIIARKMTWDDDTEGARALLDRATLEDLGNRALWRELTMLVQVAPENDVLPVRAQYPGSPTNTIGLNHLKSPQPLWFTLADCLASKLLIGRAPRIVRALRFRTGAAQRGLQATAINGNPDFRVRPGRDDFYKLLIELRQSVKRQRDAVGGTEREQLDAMQNALKIAANATSYGILAEVNVDEPRKTTTVRVHTGSERSFAEATRTVEEPGRYFHPLVATLITGAARLMLALAERLVADAGLEWAFCDTDSMAIARPPLLDEADFHARVDAVVRWFEALNPYAFPGSVLKVEDVNADLADASRRAPLFCYAVSAKRYALFNLDALGRPVLRKASAHGLGHLREPYDASNPAQGIPAPSASLAALGVALWQHDLWWVIARAALAAPVVQLPLDHHPGLRAPAVSRYAATTPAIHAWFARHNADRPYDEQVRPFGFLNAYGARVPGIAPVAPFDRDLERSAAGAFDRVTGAPVPSTALQTYEQALAQYHLQAESKFRNARPLDSGTTERRHVLASGTMHIGKEANRWEEQFYLGLDAEAEVAYGSAPDGDERLCEELRRAALAAGGQRDLADELVIAREIIRRLLAGGRVTDQMRTRILRSLSMFWMRHRDQEIQLATAIERTWEEVRTSSLTEVAQRYGVDTANFGKMLRGTRPMTTTVREALLRGGED